MKKVFYILIMIVILSTTALNAQTFSVGYLNYSVNDDGYSVTVTGHVDGTEAEGSINIPNMVPYNGRNYLVTAIGRNAFAGTRSLHGTLTIGNNVTDIGYGAFYHCDSLTGNLIIPNSVTHIGPYAFNDCDRFTGSLTIPNSVVSIGNYAFKSCEGFDDTLTIGSSVADIGAGAFIVCPNFTHAVSLAIEPPYLEPNMPGDEVHVFYGFGCSTLTVPCGSKEAYENSPWKTIHGIAGAILSYGFENIVQNCESEDECESVSTAVYPNPAKDHIKLEFSDSSDCQSISIYSIDGRLVETSPETSHQTTIDISGLHAGMYIMKIRMANGKMFIEKIIINH